MLKKRLDGYKKKFNLLLNKSRIYEIKIWKNVWVGEHILIHCNEFKMNMFRLDKSYKEKWKYQFYKNNTIWRFRTIELITKIDTLSPLKILTRGYSIAETDGAVVKSIQQLKIDDKVDVKFADGKIKAKVEEIKSLEY